MCHTRGEFIRKGKLEVGDKVHIAGGLSAQERELLVDVDGCPVFSVSHDWIKVHKRNGEEATVHRKYLCAFGGYIGHLDSPCMFCGYEEPKNSNSRRFASSGLKLDWIEQLFPKL